MRRSLLLILLPLLAAGLAVCLAACGAKTSEQVDTTAPVPVSLQTTRRGTIRRVISATGTVKPATGGELLVTIPQAARIAEMPKGVGDRVHRGDLLVRFDIPTLEADAASRRADAVRAQSRLTLAKANFARVQGLFERGIAARKEVEDARRELTDAEAGVIESQTTREAAGKLAGRQIARAPFDGVIAERTHNPGDLVESSSEVILRVIDPSRLQVEAQIPVDQLATIAVGNPARVRGPGGALFAARVIARPPAVDPATSSASIRLEFTQGTSLPAGTPVQVEVGGEEHQDAVVAPAAAVVQQGPETFLYTVDAQSHAHLVKVQTGITTAAEVEVVSGVPAGARVVVEGQNGLPDGATVVLAPPPGQSPAPAPATQPEKQP